MQSPAARDQEDPEGEEPEIPGQWATEVVTHVVDPQQLVVEEALDDVKESPPKQKEPTTERHEGAASTAPVPHGGDHARDHQQPRAGVEHAVGNGVQLQTIDRVDGVAGYIADQMMPLEDLMQDDAIDETPQAQAEQESGRR